METDAEAPIAVTEARFPRLNILGRSRTKSATGQSAVASLPGQAENG